MGKKVELSMGTQKIIMLSFIVPLLLGGIAFCYFFHVKYILVNSDIKKSWIKTPCKIILLDVESKTSKINNRKRKPGRKKKSTSYYYVTEYKYSYENNNYTSNVYNKQQWFTVKSNNKLNIRAAEIKKRKPTECYVNPKDPKQAVLDPTIIPGSEIMLWIGLGFIGVSLLCVFKFFALVRKNKDNCNPYTGEEL